MKSETPQPAAAQLDLTVADVNAINALLDKAAPNAEWPERKRIADLMWKLTFIGQRIERQSEVQPPAAATQDETLALVNQALTKAGSRHIVGTKDGAIVACTIEEAFQSAAATQEMTTMVDDEFVERYIASLPWSEHATEDERALVIGNIRGFAETLRKFARPDPLQGIREAKYLNPVCAIDGCQWLRLTRNIAATLEADMQDQPLRLWDGIRHAIGVIGAEPLQPAAATQETEPYNSKAVAWDFISKRSDDAHAYCQQHLMPGAWGHNVWHAILDDAIRMRSIVQPAAASLPYLELVAAAVHEAWMQQKRAKGITSAPSQSTGEEQMRPYAELSNEVQEYDRATVRAVYAAIEQLKGSPHQPTSEDK